MARGSPSAICSQGAGGSGEARCPLLLLNFITMFVGSVAHHLVSGGRFRFDNPAQVVHSGSDRFRCLHCRTHFVYSFNALQVTLTAFSRTLLRCGAIAFRFGSSSVSACFLLVTELCLTAYCHVLQKKIPVGCSSHKAIFAVVNPFDLWVFSV